MIQELPVYIMHEFYDSYQTNDEVNQMNILITGTAGGIAKTVVEKLSTMNHHIYVTVHTKKQLELIQNRYQGQQNITCLKLDVTNKKDYQKLEGISIDVLISNAGIGYGGSIAEMPVSLIRDNYEVNVFSNIEFIQFMLKGMIQRKHGRIVIMSSLAGEIPIPFLGSYASSKASLSILAATLRLEMQLLNKNIDVVTIKPGLYQTGFNQVMTENKYERMTIDTYFKKQLEWLKKYETPFYHLLETKNLNGIANKIVKATIVEKPKMVYQSRISQVFFVKLYHLLFE